MNQLTNAVDLSAKSSLDNSCEESVMIARFDLTLLIRTANKFLSPWSGEIDRAFELIEVGFEEPIYS